MVAKKKTLRKACTKTKLCKYEASTCPKGPHCNFAHDESELMPLPDLIKTRMCPRLLNSGVCTEVACYFAHCEEELKELPPPRPQRRPHNVEILMTAPDVTRAPIVGSMSNSLRYEPAPLNQQTLKLLHEERDRRGSKDSTSGFSQASTCAPTVYSRRDSKFSDMSAQFTADEYEYFASRRVSLDCSQEAFQNMGVPMPTAALPRLSDGSGLVAPTLPSDGQAARSARGGPMQMSAFHQRAYCEHAGRRASAHGERAPSPLRIGDAEGAKFCPALLSVGVCADAHCRYIHTQPAPAPASPPWPGSRGLDCGADSDLDDSDSDCSPRYKIPVLSDTSEGQLLVKNTFITVEQAAASPPRRRSV